MVEDEVYKEAVKVISYLVDYVIDEIKNTSNKYDYEVTWVLQEFKKQMNNVKI